MNANRQGKALTDIEAMQRIKDQHKDRMKAFESLILENFNLNKSLSENKKRLLFRKIREKAVFLQESIDLLQRIFRPENQSNVSKRFK